MAIVRALTETRRVIHGKKGAAKMLGINPRVLGSRIDQIGIKKPSAC
jgi:transcriptional regulator with GAF, ATPase, and Fis domain